MISSRYIYTHTCILSRSLSPIQWGLVTWGTDLTRFFFFFACGLCLQGWQRIFTFVLSQLDYYNSVLVSLPSCLLDKFQWPQNNAIHIFLHMKKVDHATYLLHHLHWMPVQAWIKYKIITLCYIVFMASLHITCLSWSLWSDSIVLLFMPCIRWEKFGKCSSFPILSPFLFDKSMFEANPSSKPISFKK